MVNIAGLGTATHVYLSVRVDVDDADHELFSKDWTSTGAKLDAVDTHSGAKSTIFDLLKDGQAHTFYFLFWADVASQATIDVVQLWEGIGSCQTAWTSPALRFNHTGLVFAYYKYAKIGTGTPFTILAADRGAISEYSLAFVYQFFPETAPYPRDRLIMVKDYTYFVTYNTVATDLTYLDRLFLNLRSEQ